ncbi:MAG: hypothetical protein QXR73_00380 [Candidatus Micrarchaeaceae archaeon]
MANFKKIAIIIAVIFVIAIVAGGFYLSFELSHIHITPAPPPVVLPTSLSTYVSYQALLDNNESRFVVPYAELSYSVSNLTELYINVSLLESKFPTKVYMLNASQSGCVNCGDFQAFLDGVQSDLALYGLTPEVGNLTVINESSLPSISNNSILIIPNGLMPQAMLSNYGSSNITLIHYLLDRGTSIIYIGNIFSSVVLPNGVIIPNTRIPSYMLTTSPVSSNSIFSFDSPVFSFSSGLRYGDISYINVLNGSIVAFSNYLDSWPSPSAASEDMAKAIASGFWLPRYASGSEAIALNASKAESGSSGIEMLNPKINYSVGNVAALETGWLHAEAYTNSSYGYSGKSLYKYINEPSDYLSNGTVSLPSIVILGSSQPITLQIYTNSSVPIQIQPHLSVYTENMIKVSTIPLSLISATGNFTFVKLIKSTFVPGMYIIQLKGFSDNLYASALFNVPAVEVAETYSNYTSNAFRFYVSSDGVPLTGLGYTMTLNGKYPLNGTLTNGTIYYSLPSGVGEQFGTLNFTAKILSQDFSYVASNPAPVIKITSKDIALIIAVVVILLMVTMVRAPNRDDFFIDVSHLPKQQRTFITLNPQDVMSVFQKLNTYYHWRYMPLSVSEFKLAIASNIRYNGIPVNLTPSNVEVLLDQLIANGMVISADDLYAPKGWVEESKHDIEYLAVFKKLRIYMVTHAYVFTDLDISQTSDMNVVVGGDKHNIVIYAPSSRFKDIPISMTSKTFIAFMNDDRLEDFRDRLYSVSDAGAEQLKLYISAGYVKLISMENPVNIFD